MAQILLSTGKSTQNQLDISHRDACAWAEVGALYNVTKPGPRKNFTTHDWDKIELAVLLQTFKFKEMAMVATPTPPRGKDRQRFPIKWAAHGGLKIICQWHFRRVRVTLQLLDAKVGEKSLVNQVLQYVGMDLGHATGMKALSDGRTQWQQVVRGCVQGFRDQFEVIVRDPYTRPVGW